MMPIKDSKRILVFAKATEQGIVSQYNDGALPRLRNGAMMEIYISAGDFLDEKELIALTVERHELFLPPGERLFVRLLDARMEQEEKQKCLKVELWPGSIQFMYGAEVVLEEPLEMHLAGSKKGSLMDAKCMIPALNNEEAKSVNHAYTKLSRHYEVKRRSAGGNVFENVYVQRERRWILLKALRDEMMAAHERDMIASLVPKATDAEAELLKRGDIKRGLAKGDSYIGSPGACGCCAKDLAQGALFVDGNRKGDSGWANMCAECFLKEGLGIGWGVGQLYQKQAGGTWLLVGGFR
jgi:hypothetical protein